MNGGGLERCSDDGAGSVRTGHRPGRLQQQLVIGPGIGGFTASVVVDGDGYGSVNGGGGFGVLTA
jgi:hypothetical protein